MLEADLHYSVEIIFGKPCYATACIISPQKLCHFACFFH
jgi:hypothetical protein